jgi:hypothetical protein
LAVGLCIGAAVGYSQWNVLKKYFPVNSFWGLACTIGIGIPVMAVSLFEDAGTRIPYLWNSEFLSALAVGIVGGMITGLLQIHLLMPYTKKAGWWVVISTVGWGLCSLAQRISGTDLWFLCLLAGGIILGVVTYAGLSWIIKLRVPGK